MMNKVFAKDWLRLFQNRFALLNPARQFCLSLPRLNIQSCDKG